MSLPLPLAAAFIYALLGLLTFGWFADLADRRQTASLRELREQFAGADVKERLILLLAAAIASLLLWPLWWLFFLMDSLRGRA